MTDRKLVSIITPTWNRHGLLLETIEDVRRQTYRPLEHVIVSDGPDDELDEIVRRAMFDQVEPTPSGKLIPDERVVPIYFVELGRNWSSFLPASFCAAPTTAAMLLARGDYQTWWVDDERMDPDHIRLLVDALEAGGADFAYSRCRFYRLGLSPEHGFDIGTDPPQHGQITNCLYRADLLKRGLYPFGRGMTSDWACIEQWMRAGATWAFVDRVTFSHRADH